MSEKLRQDESFKLSTHAFLKVQTMNQINDRHIYEEEAEAKKHHSRKKKRASAEEEKQLRNKVVEYS